MFAGLAKFLKERRDKIVRTQKLHRWTTGMSGFQEAVTSGEFDVVDFDALMAQIEEFEKTFRK